MSAFGKTSCEQKELDGRKASRAGTPETSLRFLLHIFCPWNPEARFPSVLPEQVSGWVLAPPAGLVSADAFLQRPVSLLGAPMPLLPEGIFRSGQLGQPTWALPSRVLPFLAHRRSLPDLSLLIFPRLQWLPLHRGRRAY